MIRVLHVLNELRPSGAETMLAHAGPLWTGAGIECDVLSLGASPGPYAPVLRTAGYGIEHVPFRRTPWFFAELARLIRHGDYDVVHVHAERANFYLAATARLAGTQCVRTVHNAFPFTGFLRVRKEMFRNLSRRAGVRFVAVGQSVQWNERRTFTNECEVVSNWIDVDRFAPPTDEHRETARREFGAERETFVLVSVGNCNPTKNHESLLRALAAFDGEWLYLHVGEEGSDRAERELAEHLGIADRVGFLGPRDPLPVLHAADAFVAPSHFEGFPVAVIEALATGLPLILSDVTGNRDISGLARKVHWSNTTPASIGAALARCRLAKHKMPAGSEATEQHARVAARHSPTRGVAEYAHHYHELVDSVGRVRHNEASPIADAEFAPPDDRDGSRRATRICVVIASRNRRERTLRCLNALEAQDAPIELSAVLVDDASTDGTYDAVVSAFPWVTVLRGDGQLYWNGGTHLAFSQALHEGADHYLLLNDDTVLDSGGVRTLLDAHRTLRAAGDDGIVAGSMRDPVTGDVTYGGVVRPSPRRFPARYELQQPAATDVRDVETVHGNCVLIPNRVAGLVGPNDVSYQHAMGDFDYGWRVRSAGFRVVLAPGTVGQCSRNPARPAPEGPVLRRVVEELHHLRSAKGLPPRDWARFLRRWGGPIWPVFWAATYSRAIWKAATGGLAPRTSDGRR